MERTLAIIKPDATRWNLTGKINARFEDKGLRIVYRELPILGPESLAASRVALAASKAGNACPGVWSRAMPC